MREVTRVPASHVLAETLRGRVEVVALERREHGCVMRAPLFVQSAPIGTVLGQTFTRGIELRALRVRQLQLLEHPLVSFPVPVPVPVPAPESTPPMAASIAALFEPRAHRRNELGPLVRIERRMQLVEHLDDPSDVLGASPLLLLRDALERGDVSGPDGSDDRRAVLAPRGVV